MRPSLLILNGPDSDNVLAELTLLTVVSQEALVNLGVVPRGATGNAVGAVCRAMDPKRKRMGHCSRYYSYNPAVGTVSSVAHWCRRQLSHSSFTYRHNSEWPTFQ